MKISLPNVHIILVDCLDYDRTKLALDHCQSFIDFGDASILTSIEIDSPEIIKIPPINSIPSYSDFMIYDLNKYITKEFVLVAQWDGFIRDISLWDDSYLDYDYIGAPWPATVLFPGVPSQFNVGNGGFSIRSKRLMDFIASDSRLTYHHLEDVMICQLNRAYLEMHGFKFAPAELAAKFSWECGPEHPSFGVHQRLKLVRPA